MLAVSHGEAVSQGEAIPLAYWQAECEDDEEALAKHALHVSRVEWERKANKHPGVA